MATNSGRSVRPPVVLNLPIVGTSNVNGEPAARKPTAGTTTRMVRPIHNVGSAWPVASRRRLAQRPNATVATIARATALKNSHAPGPKIGLGTNMPRLLRKKRLPRLRLFDGFGQRPPRPPCR